MSRTVGGVTEDYAYDDGDKLQTVKIGGVTQKSYGYDTAGRTTSVVSSAGTTTLAYDYEGRISTITYPSTATNTFVYNGLDTRVSKIDSAGTSTYKRDGAGVTAPVLSDGGATYTPGISERRSSTTTFLHSGLKNADSQSGTSQTVTATKQYDAFGNTLTSTGTWQGPFGYAGSFGYQEDADSSLKLLGHRYYDPSTGRFLTRDPIKDGRNWFVYCDNNPVSCVDPEGLRWHNPSQVKVSPDFKGSIIAIGEPGPDKPQIAVSLGPGQQTNPKMDVDLVIVKRPGKPDEIYFIGGNKNDESGIGDYWIINHNGDIKGPPFVFVISFDYAIFPPGTRWRKDIEKAIGRPTPGSMKPQPYNPPRPTPPGRAPNPDSGQWAPIGGGPKKET